MDKLLSLTLPLEDFDKEHYEELLKLVEKRYGITLEQIIDSRIQEEISDDMYYALDMLMIDPIKWCNVCILRKEPELDINFVNELKMYTCQFERKCKGPYIATNNGHLECLKYLSGQQHFGDSSLKFTAALNGRLECLKYLHENGCPWDTHTCSNAALSGHLDCLKYAVENRCPIDKDKCIRYAKGRYNLNCLEYLESL